MLKKVFFFLLIVSSPLYGWVDPLGRGFSSATYLGTKETVNIDDTVNYYRNKIGREYSAVNKLKKEQFEWIENALYEYDLKEGEIYDVWLTTLGGFTILIIEINKVFPNNSFEYNWYGVGVYSVYQ